MINESSTRPSTLISPSKARWLRLSVLYGIVSYTIYVLFHGFKSNLRAMFDDDELLKAMSNSKGPLQKNVHPFFPLLIRCFSFPNSTYAVVLIGLVQSMAFSAGAYLLLSRMRLSTNSVVMTILVSVCYRYSPSAENFYFGLLFFTIYLMSYEKKIFSIFLFFTILSIPDGAVTFLAFLMFSIILKKKMIFLQVFFGGSLAVVLNFIIGYVMKGDWLYYMDIPEFVIGGSLRRHMHQNPFMFLVSDLMLYIVGMVSLFSSYMKIKSLSILIAIYLLLYILFDREYYRRVLLPLVFFSMLISADMIISSIEKRVSKEIIAVASFFIPIVSAMLCYL